MGTGKDVEFKTPISKESASVGNTWWYTGLSPISWGNRKRELQEKGPLESPVTGQELETFEECQNPTPVATTHPSLHMAKD